MEQENQKKSQSGMALASLVMGIVGLVSVCCFGGVLFGSLGILFALLSRTEKQFEGYAKAGLITSSIALGLSVAAIILFFVYMGITAFQGGAFS